MFGRQPIVKLVINRFQASRGNSAFQTDVPSIGKFPPGAFDPASTGLPVPGGRLLLLSHPVTECERDCGRFSPMLIVPSGIVGLSSGQCGTRCCWLVQLLIRAALPVGRDLNDFKCPNSVLGKYFRQGLRLYNPMTASSLVIQDSRTAPLPSLRCLRSSLAWPLRSVRSAPCCF